MAEMDRANSHLISFDLPKKVIEFLFSVLSKEVYMLHGLYVISYQIMIERWKFLLTVI